MIRQVYTLLFIISSFSVVLNAQVETSLKCGSSEAMSSFFENHSNEQHAWEDFNETETLNTRGGDACPSHYVIPVVIHVFDNEGMEEVTPAQIQAGLDKANTDFAGENTDFNSVDPAFSNVRGTLNVTFVLASIDPNGNPTTGINYYGDQAGFGNGSGYDSQVSSYAWDNYKYMNVYLMNDLYDNDDLYNSGVAWYPNSWMSNNNLARVVYNHWYWGDSGSSTADPEFQSVVTHEFGHWLNLIHTFENGCAGGDLVDDTPNTETAAGCGPDAFSCGHIINGENYMDYNATCYKMFTQGQIDRATNALENHPTREPLWQRSNLEATGVLDFYDYAIPSPIFITSATTVEVGESVLFTDLTCGLPDFWSWTINGGDPVASFEQNPTSVFNTAGVYDVTLTVGGSSTPYTIQITVEDTMTDIENVIENSKTLEIYLSNDILTTNIDDFELYDMVGKKVMGTNIGSMNVHSLASGVYIVLDKRGMKRAERLFIP